MKIEKAKEYCRGYGTELPHKWKGLKVIKHPWHQPAIMIAYPMQYGEFIERIIEVAEFKPPYERATRLALMKPYEYEFTLPKYVTTAGNIYYKAKEALIKAQKYNEGNYGEAYGDAERAMKKYDGVVERWQKANAKKIAEAHEKECPNCLWDGEKLPQFD